MKRTMIILMLFVMVLAAGCAKRSSVEEKPKEVQQAVSQTATTAENRLQGSRSAI